MKHFDIVIVGGGVVGLSTAYGLLQKESLTVAILDEGDIAFRASRSNFGLVWFQGKGVGNQDYVRLVRRSTGAWQHFAEQLQRESGIDLGFHQSGGLSLCIGERAAEARRARVNELRQQAGGEGYECEFLNRRQLQHIFGRLQLGPAVQTASFSPADGHVNPLRLLAALQKRFVDLRGRYLGNHRVEHITPVAGGGFELQTRAGVIGCQQLILTAGLGIAKLSPYVGLDIPMRPERGQILVTQRTAPVFPLPMNGFRQTDEGSILLGYSNEDAGFDDTTSAAVVANIAGKAAATFPQLATLRLVRAWAGLRTQSPDRYPVYARSQHFPGAYAALCHSGITLAAVHAEMLPEWVLSGRTPATIKAFGTERFNV